MSRILNALGAMSLQSLSVSNKSSDAIFMTLTLLEVTDQWMFISLDVCSIFSWVDCCDAFGTEILYKWWFSPCIVAVHDCCVPWLVVSAGFPTVQLTLLSVSKCLGGELLWDNKCPVSHHAPTGFSICCCFLAIQINTTVFAMWWLHNPFIPSAFISWK